MTIPRSVLNDILDATVTGVDGLDLVLSSEPSSPIPVVKRKLPKKEEVVDPPVQITVCKSETPEQVKWYAFPSTNKPKGTVRVKYSLEVTIISPNNDDQYTNLPDYAYWREKIRVLFSTKAAFSGVSEVIDCDAKLGVYLDRDQINENYDYQTVGLIVTTIESGG